MANTRLIQIQGPQTLPVTLEQVKEFARIDTDETDDMIQGLIEAAVSYFDGKEGILGRVLMQQTWMYWLSEWPSDDHISLPLGPVLDITSITYLDSTGTEQTLATTEYVVTENGDITISDTGSWPSVYANRYDAIRITFDVGYLSDTSPEQTTIPEAIKQAIIATVAHWYDKGDDIPAVATTLIAPFKRGRLGY